MGIKTGDYRKGNNSGFGNLVSLRPVSSSSVSTSATTTEVTNNNNKKQNGKVLPKTKLSSKTRVIRISEELYQRFFDFSRIYYNSDSYETILSDLLDNYQKQNKEREFRFLHYSRI